MEFDPSVSSLRSISIVLLQIQRERPTCEAMTVPKLDVEVKDQLIKKGKDPHFGQEKSLYKFTSNFWTWQGPSLVFGQTC